MQTFKSESSEKLKISRPSTNIGGKKFNNFFDETPDIELRKESGYLTSRA